MNERSGRNKETTASPVRLKTSSFRKTHAVLKNILAMAKKCDGFRMEPLTLPTVRQGRHQASRTLVTFMGLCTFAGLVMCQRQHQAVGGILGAGRFPRLSECCDGPLPIACAVACETECAAKQGTLGKPPGMRGGPVRERLADR